MKRVLGKGLEALIPGAGNDDKDISELSNLNVIHDLPLEKIKPSPFQPRSAFDPTGLAELSQSIEARGVIQPIVVRMVGDFYELIAGERRLRAVELLGRKTIAAVVHDTISNQEAMELALIENIQRQDLNPIEEAAAYHRLLTECSLTQADISTRVGKDRSSIANSIRLLSLPYEIKEMVSSGQLSAGHARALLAISSDSEKISLAKKAAENDLSVRSLEKLVYADNSPKKAHRTKLRSAQVVALEEELKKTMGTKVLLNQRRKGGRIIIEYYSNDELDRLLNLFGIKGNF
jgi:ParB family transcriptional regulator, chromosome partitioning protein